MRRTWLDKGAIALGFLLVAVASPAAAELGTITTGQAYNFDQPARGFLRIIGTFTSSEPLDLGAAGGEATLT
jgi:hypothetical protein